MANAQAVKMDPTGVPLPTISDREAISLLNQTSKNMRMADYVYTANREGSAMVVDGAPPGPLGRLFVIPYDEVVEVPEEVARQMTEHRAYDGVVRVGVTRTRTGTSFEVEPAKAASLELIEKQDRIFWSRWVNDSVEDYIKRSKPVPPPSQRILAIIKRRGWKPEDYGIVPIGWAKPGLAELQEAQKEKAELMDIIKGLSARLNALEAAPGDEEEEKKRKRS